MKKIIMSLVILSVFAFGYLEINDVVGKVIDAREAQYYRIFTDVPGFESARFVENGDSILIELNTAIDSVHDTQYRNIDRKIYISLGDFIKDFKRITMNPVFRNDFVRKHTLGWPLVTQRETDHVISEFNRRRNLNAAFCMSCIVPSSAYTGAWLGREVIHTYYGECMMTYNLIRINPATYFGVTAAGTLTGCLLTTNLPRLNIKEGLLKKDIVAFDKFDQPITLQDINYARISNNRIFYGCLGLGLGCSGAIITFYGLLMPFLSDMFQSDWESNAVFFPIIGVSLSEIAIITKFFIEEGNKRDLKATIEKIKQKRMKEHLKSQKAIGHRSLQPYFNRLKHSANPVINPVNFDNWY